MLCYSIWANAAFAAKNHSSQSNSPVINIKPTNNRQLDKLLQEHKKQLEEKIKITATHYPKDFAEIEGKTLFLQLLKSLGYYAAEVEILEREENSSNIITFQVTPMEQYTIGDIKTKIQDFEGKAARLSQPLYPLSNMQEKPAAAGAILKEEKKLHDFIEKNNCLTAIKVSHQAIIDHINKKVDIAYNVTIGYTAYLNKVTFEGLEKVNPDYARKLVPIKDAACFRHSTINEATVVLQKSGLFAFVQPVFSEIPTPNGGVDLKFKVKEGLHRNVKAGIAYSTDLGLGGTAGWEHNNLMANGEQVTTTLSANKLETILDSQFEKPFFLLDNQKLKLGVTIEKKRTEAFKSQGVATSASIERKFSARWTGEIGAKYDFSRIQDEIINKRFALLSFPVFIINDSRDDTLNPQKGWVLKAETAPFINTAELNTTFLKNRLSASYYFHINTAASPVLAVRAVGSTIVGVNTASIPATERFYVGGSGSVRGYEYQMLGTLNKKNDPLGGSSAVETSTELRLMVSKKFGVVAFIDGGNSFNPTYDKALNKLFWGTGIGLRYYTGFGPIRADLAFPLNKRKKIDKNFQLYFSIGQAF